MCDKAVDDNPDALEFVPDQQKTHEMCDKAVEFAYVTWQKHTVIKWDI